MRRAVDRGFRAAVVVAPVGVAVGAVMAGGCPKGGVCGCALLLLHRARVLWVVVAVQVRLLLL